MKIKFTPQRSDRTVKYEVEGQKLILNMNQEIIELDFTELPDGVMQECEYPIKSCKKADGVVYLELVTPHGKDASEEILYPNEEYAEMQGVIYEYEPPKPIERVEDDEDDSDDEFDEIPVIEPDDVVEDEFVDEEFINDEFEDEIIIDVEIADPEDEIIEEEYEILDEEESEVEDEVETADGN